MTAPRRIQFPADIRFDDYTDYQCNYMNYRTGWLIPNTEVWIGGEVRMKINALGCKGADLAPDVPVIGVFGDSTTFGAGPDSWPAHIRVAGYQPLNCGVEGHDFTRHLERFGQLRDTVRLAAVIAGGSWHNLVYNRTDEGFWVESLDAFGDDLPVGVCTLSTSLVPAVCERGLDAAIAAQYGGGRFESWGKWPTTPEKTRELYDGVMRYNDFVRGYCERSGRILIDLFAVYRPPSYEQMGDHFMDPAHQRATLYPVLGAVVAAALAPHLEGREEEFAQPAVNVVATRPIVEDDALHRNIYPLW